MKLNKSNPWMGTIVSNKLILRSVGSLAVLAAILGLGGCAAPVISPQIERADLSPIPQPPAPMAETKPPAPYADSYWIPGYWAWDGGQFQWTGGHWEQSRPNMLYQSAYWSNDRGSWIFHPGYWQPESPAPGAAPAYITVAPPLPVAEVIPVAPYPDYIWIGGFWSWRLNHHVWVGGHWEAPHPGYFWAPGHWTHYSGGWGFSGGYWHRR
jgi:hypothetical protein